MPPYLAGRQLEFREFERLLAQDVILENLILTGLRGTGKTVLLETFKPRAIAEGWLWAGTDMTEAACTTESALAQRLLSDLAIITSGSPIAAHAHRPMGFAQTPTASPVHLTYDVLESVYAATPGLVSDKVKAVLEFTWDALSRQGPTKIIFAYDEAQNLSNNAAKGEYPLSLLIDVFQAIQRKGILFMLVLSGLPTIFPKLVAARTYAERMFRVVTVTRLSDADSREAIVQPTRRAQCPVKFTDTAVEIICRESARYPYFIQFICRELYDSFIQQRRDGEQASLPIEPIQHKLDEVFYAGRWAKVPDRQRDLLWVIANLRHPHDEFTISELVPKSSTLLERGFSASQANQMLARLTEQGLIYKNRLGKYAFAIPLLGKFILRTYGQPSDDAEAE